MTVLTPQETLQAIADGKKLESKWYDSEKWNEYNPVEHLIAVSHIFSGKFVFRPAQERITIGDVSFPKPESKSLEIGTEYWVADPAYLPYSLEYPSIWCGDNTQKEYLRRGLIHLNRENAITHAKALIKLSGGNVDE